MEENSRKSIRIAKNAHFSFNSKMQNIGSTKQKNKISNFTNNVIHNLNIEDKTHSVGHHGLSESKKIFNEMLLSENSKVVTDYNNFIKAISQMHLSASVYCDWNYINSIKAPYDYNNTKIGPAESKAIMELEKFNSSKVFKALSPFIKKHKNTLESNILTAKKYDTSEFKHWEKLHKLSVGILEGDIDSYIKVIDDFKPFDDITELGSFFIINFNSSQVIEIEFRVNEDSLMPENSYSLGENGQLLETPYTKKEFYSIINSFISSTTIRVARDMFAILPIKTVYVQVIKNVPNTYVGISEVTTVVSVEFTREKLDCVDLNNTDATAILENFPHNRNFVVGEGFRAVPRLGR